MGSKTKALLLCVKYISCILCKFKLYTQTYRSIRNTALTFHTSLSRVHAEASSWKTVDCFLWVEVLPLVEPLAEELKYFEVLFTIEGRMKRDIDRQINAASAVLQTL